MKKHNRKGFTIVELVIVIAVVGVLAAILIPTFVSLTKKANKASDQSLVANLNKALAMREGEADDTKNNTMHDAVLDLKLYGFELDVLANKSDEDLVYDLAQNRFLLNPSQVEGHQAKDLWKIVNAIPTEETAKYNYYAGVNFSEEDPVNVKGGFDAGYKNVPTVNYTTSVFNEVVIRTNSVATTLTINAGEDTVHHFGNVGKVLIEAIDMDCYNESGKAGYVRVDAGKVVAKEGGSIAIAFANNKNGELVRVVEDKGEIEKGYTTVQAVDTKNQQEGGIALEYSEDPLHQYTEETLEETIEEAIDELAAEEVAEDPDAAKYVARVGAKGYETFAEAVAAAREKGIKAVVVLGDLTVDSNITIDNEIIFNDYRSITFTGNYYITLQPNAKFTLNGNALNLVADSSACGFYNCNLFFMRNAYNNNKTVANILKDFEYTSLEDSYFIYGGGGFGGPRWRINQIGYGYDGHYFETNESTIGMMYDTVFRGDTLKFYLDEYTGTQTYNWTWDSDKYKDNLNLDIEYPSAEPDAIVITFNGAEDSNNYDDLVTITLTGTTTDGENVTEHTWTIKYAYSNESSGTW